MAAERAKELAADEAILAKDVEAKKVRWLWRDRVPIGMLTIVAGRPDQGKGMFAAHVAADVSKRGGNVIYSAIEDDHGMMTRPRLEASGANLNRILLWRFSVPTQLGELEERIKTTEAKLVVIDPIGAHLSGGISQMTDSIRKVTTPLSKLAEKYDLAVIIVAHALKKVPKSAHPLSAIGGASSGLPAASRMGFLFGTDPNDSDRRILACVKSNIRSKPKALSFETDTEDVGLVGEIPYMICQGECEFDPMRLLGGGGEPGKVGRRPDKRQAAQEWLVSYLVAAGKPVKAGEVLEDADQHGMTKKTVLNAAADLKLVKDPPGGGRSCTWDLPDKMKKALGQ